MARCKKKDWEKIANDYFNKSSSTNLSQSSANSLGTIVHSKLSESMQQLLSILDVTPNVTETFLVLKMGTSSHPVLHSMISSVLTSGLTKSDLTLIAKKLNHQSTSLDLASELLQRLSIPLQSLLANLKFKTDSLAQTFLNSTTSIEVRSMLVSLVMTDLNSEKVRIILSKVKLDRDASVFVRKKEFGRAFADYVFDNNDGLSRLFQILTPRGSNFWDLLFKDNRFIPHNIQKILESDADLTGSSTRSASATGLEESCNRKDFCGDEFCNSVVTVKKHQVDEISVSDQRLSLLKEQYGIRLDKSFLYGLKFYFLLSDGQIVTNQEGAKWGQTHVFSVIIILLKLGCPSTIVRLILELHNLSQSTEITTHPTTSLFSSISAATSTALLLQSSKTYTFSSLIIGVYTSLDLTVMNAIIVKKLLLILLCLGQSLFEEHGTMFVAACLTYEPLLVLRVIHGFFFANEAVIKEVVTAARKLNSNPSISDRRDLSYLIHKKLHELGSLKDLNGCDLIPCGKPHSISSIDTLVLLKTSTNLKHPYYEYSKFCQLMDNKPANSRLEKCKNFLKSIANPRFVQKRVDFEKPMSEGKLIIGCHHCLNSGKSDTEFCRSITVASLEELRGLEIPLYCYNVNSGCGINAYFNVYLNHPHTNQNLQLLDPQAWIEDMLNNGKFTWTAKKARVRKMNLSHVSEYTKNEVMLGYGEYFTNTSERRFKWDKDSKLSENLHLMVDNQILRGKCNFDLSKIKVNGQAILEYQEGGNLGGHYKWGLVESLVSLQSSQLAELDVSSDVKVKPGQRKGGKRFSPDILKKAEELYKSYLNQTAVKFEFTFFKTHFHEMEDERLRSLLKAVKREKKKETVDGTNTTRSSSSNLAAGGDMIDNDDSEEEGKSGQIAKAKKRLSWSDSIEVVDGDGDGDGDGDSDGDVLQGIVKVKSQQAKKKTKSHLSIDGRGRLDVDDSRDKVALLTNITKANTDKSNVATIGFSSFSSSSSSSLLTSSFGTFTPIQRHDHIVSDSIKACH